LTIFETSVIILTLVRGYRFRRSLVADGAPRRWKIDSLVSIVYRDALLNYVYIPILLTIVVLFVNPREVSTALISWQRVTYAILGSHCLLNLRKANVSRSITEKSNLSTVVFRGERSTGIGNPTRSFVERVGDEVEDWLAPDPRLYPSRAGSSSMRATGTKDGSEPNSINESVSVPTSQGRDTSI